MVVGVTVGKSNGVGLGTAVGGAVGPAVGGVVGITVGAASAGRDVAAVGSGGWVGRLVAMIAAGALVALGLRLAVAPRIPITQAASTASTSPPTTPPATSSGRGRRAATGALGWLSRASAAASCS